MPDVIAPRPRRLVSSPYVSSVTSHTISPSRKLTRPHSRQISVPNTLDSLARINLSDENTDDDEASPPPASTLSLNTTFISHDSTSAQKFTYPPETLEEFLSILQPSFSRDTSHRRSSSRPHPYKMSRDREHSKSRPSSPIPNYDEDPDRATSGEGRPTISSILNSPISRIHTQNPLPRHPSYETLSSKLVFPPPSTTPTSTSSRDMDTSE